MRRVKPNRPTKSKVPKTMRLRDEAKPPKGTRFPGAKHREARPEGYTR